MLNKKRLAALGLSAVMVASTASLPVSAADFSDGAGAVTEDTTENAGVAAFSAEAESQPIEVTEETADEVGATWEFAGGVEFHYNDKKEADFTVTYVEKNEKGEERTSKASLNTSDPEQVKFEKATCQHAERVMMMWNKGGETFSSDWYNVVGGEEKKDHDFTGAVDHEYYADEYKTPITELKHGAKVWVQDYIKCKNCDEKKYEGGLHETTIEHVWSKAKYTVDFDKEGNNISNVKANEDGTVAFDEKGNPVLIDPSKDGYYNQERHCTLDNTPDWEFNKKVPVDATRATKAEVISVSDSINMTPAQLNYLLKWPTSSAKPIDEDDILMKDCSESGWYELEYSYADGRTSTEKIPVDPHHYDTYATAVFETEADAKLCEVKWDEENKKLVVRNNSCYRTVNYTEVTHCQAGKGCDKPKHNAGKAYEKGGKNNKECTGVGDTVVKTEAKTAAIAGQHKVNTKIKDAITKLVDAQGNKLLYSNLIATLKKVDPDYQKYVKISGRTDCTKAEKLTVKFICVEDKETVAETMTVIVWAEDHAYVNEAVTKKLPTCTSTGVLEETTKCKLCGDTTETRTQSIPRVKHTNEKSVSASGIGQPDYDTDTTAYIAFVGDKVVDNNGESLAYVEKNGTKPVNQNDIGAYNKNEFKVFANVYTNCTECNDHVVKLNDGIQKNVWISIVNVKKQSENGKAGSITLKATYKNSEDKTVSTEYTVPYFSSMEAYQARVEEAPINGFQKDANGKYLYYVDGKFQENVSGLVDYAGKKYLVEKGVLCDSVNGVSLVDNKAFYFFAYGVVQSQYTGVAMYDGQSFYIVNGKVDLNVNGLVPYNGGTFVFAAGRLVKEANGLYLDTDGTWYFTALGQVQTDYTGVALYDGEFFYIQNGKLAKDYKGTITYNGAKFNVSGGQLYGPIKK